MSQTISAIGQIATEPKLFAPESGVQFCTFRLACTERRFDGAKGEWADGTTNWFTVNAFRALAVNAAHSFAKGDRVVVQGRLRVRRWEKDEKHGNSVEIDAEGIGHDVRWGVSSFEKRTANAEAEPVEETAAAPADSAAEAGSEPAPPQGAEPREADGFTPLLAA